MSKIRELLPSSFTLVEEYEGHYKERGKSAKTELNTIFVINDDKNDEYCVMFCNPNDLTLFSKEDLNTVMFDTNGDRITWSKNNTLGYIMSSVLSNGKRLFLHQVIMNHYGNGKGQDSIDHINQNKLDNRRENLRITTQSVQNENRGKKARMSNACKEIPEVVLDYIQQIHNHRKLPKFVEYNLESRNDKVVKEFFTISKNHPVLKFFNLSAIKTTQGLKVSVLDKYKQVEKGVNKLNDMMEKPKEEWSFNKDDFTEWMRE